MLHLSLYQGGTNYAKEVRSFRITCLLKTNLRAIMSKKEIGAENMDTLTESSYTQWKHTVMTKEHIDKEHIYIIIVSFVFNEYLFDH